MIYDTAIIGCGPAGLSAAITLKIRNKNVCIISDSIPSKKLTGNHRIINYLGYKEITGGQLGCKALEQIKSLNIKTIKEKVNTVYAIDNTFNIQTNKQNILQSKTIIIATGINQKSSYQGEKKLLGRGVSYCATCDGMLYKNKTVAVIGDSTNIEMEIGELKFLSEVCKNILFIPNTNIDKKINRLSQIKNTQIEVAKDIKISGDDKVEKIYLDGKEQKIDAVFILRDSIDPDQLVPGLKVKNAHVQIGNNMQTNINGCFACGDITGLPYQYIKAAGQGNIAALSCVKYLNNISN